MNNAKSTPSKNLIFIVAPNLGCIDLWLPIFYYFKQFHKEQGRKVYFAIPSVKTAENIILEDSITRLSCLVCDGIYAIDLIQRWSFFNSFESLVASTHNKRFLKIIPKIRRALKRFRLNFMLKLYNKLISKIFPYNDSIFNNLSVESTAVCYDVYTNDVPEVDALLKKFNKNKYISMCHGIYIHDQEPKPPMIAQDNSNTLCLLFSDSEKNYYNKLYNLAYNHMYSIGVVRHNQEWINFVTSSEHDRIAKELPFDSPYVFIVSRPGSTKYFSYQKKKRAIETLKKIFIQNKNFKLVIRLHPKEGNQGIYEEVLGKENYGITWTYSTLHFFTIAQNAHCCITFFSGMSVDLVRIQVPIIQYLEEDEFTKNDVTIMNFLEKEFGYYASSEDELLKYIDYIENDRKGYIEKFVQSYRRFLPEPMPLDKLISLINTSFTSTH